MTYSFVLDATTEDEAAAVNAASPDLVDSWGTPQKYATEDKSITISAGDLGFSAVPNVGEVREHYGITPG
ncbi:hypothetical protein SAMN04488564_108136 [Lentzea waywayandensis]|uniref:Uncharacterized protein n=1 Tax=Lentzea waywayandensis TaxID=84724 RepID=A0A1I6F4M7_9PSEU|nr:hypothetical protein [Lentzea waywayandensis]SFR24901.1 hypothetical protein SAMN04488564_108136 [Lentzea waywayandensis]